MTKESAKYLQSKFKGIRYREHPTRRHGLKPDRYFAIRYQHNGVRIEEGLGWGSAGWTEEKAFAKLTLLREAAKTVSAAPTRIFEERAIKIEEKRQKADELQRQADEELRLEKENLTFRQYFTEKYIPIANTDKKAKCCINEKGHFSKWLDPVIGAKSFKEISSFDLERIKKNLLDAGRTPRTVQYVFATFRQVWNTARKDSEIPVYSSSPSKDVKVPKFDNKRDRFLSKVEATLLLDTLRERDLLLYRISIMAVYTGLRLGEITALKWKDIDLERGMIRIMDPKATKNRYAYMSSHVNVMLSEMAEGDHNDLVFTNLSGRRITDIPDAFNSIIDELGLNKGVTDRRHKVVFHTLRHTFASWLVECGVNLYTVKELMGHSVIAMTERYSHLAPTSLKAAMQSLEESPINLTQKAV